MWVFPGVFYHTPGGFLMSALSRMTRAVRPALDLSLYPVADRKVIPLKEVFIGKIKSATKGGVPCLK